MKCAKCGKEIGSRAVVCTNCGTRVYPAARPAAAPAPVQAASPVASAGEAVGGVSRFNIVIIALSAVLVIALAVVAFLLFGTSSPTPPPAREIALSNVNASTVVAHGIEAMSDKGDSTSSDSEDDDDFDFDDDDELAPFVYYYTDNRVTGSVDDGDTDEPEAGESDDGDEGDSGDESSQDSVHDLLKAYYAAAGGYDKDIEACAADFNTYFLKKSRDTRESCATNAAYLDEEIYDMWQAVYDMDVPTSSSDYSSWEKICELYECLWHRIDVICEAWSISLEYDDPKPHEEEILAPIAADLDGSNNKYYTRFKELYPTVDL